RRPAGVWRLERRRGRNGRRVPRRLVVPAQPQRHRDRRHRLPLRQPHGRARDRGLERRRCRHTGSRAPRALAPEQPPGAGPGGLLLGAALVSTVLSAAPLAGAASATNLLLTGHGWGHGRGMGQWGALGYALDHGWNDQQILDHFYGGTATAGGGDIAMSVRL